MDSKRLWIVMLVMAGGLMFFVYYTKQKQQQEQLAQATVPHASPTAATAAAEPNKVATPTSGTGAAPAVESAAAAYEWFASTAPQPTWSAIGSLDAKQFPFQMQMTTEGAAVGTLKLASYYAAVEDKQLANKLDGNEAAYEKIVAENPGKYHGHYSLMNPVQLPTQRFLPLATRRVSIVMPGQNEPLSWRLDNRNWVKEDKVRTTQPADGNTQSVTFSWSLYRDPNFADAGRVAKNEQFKPFLILYKTYTVKSTDQSVHMTLEAENLSGMPLKIAIDQGGPAGMPSEDPTNDLRSAVITKQVEGTIKSFVKPLTDAQKMNLGVKEPVGFSKEPASVSTLWLAEINKFFGSVMYVEPSGPGKNEATDRKAEFYIAAAEEGPNARTYMTGVNLGVEPDAPAAPAQDLAAGERWQVDFDLFAGPKKRDMFDEPGAPYFKPLYRDLKYINTIDFGSCFCTSNWLALGMMWLLQMLSKLSFGNYGVAIILLVVVVRLVLHPLTKKSQVMMMKTQKLAPQMQKLKTKYADDKDALNKEMMKLYKDQGFTPLLGCLPMLLQMPIWIALWGGLNASVELRHAAFLPIWLTDLAAPDKLITFSSALPLIGTSFHLLPILVAVSMFFQTKLNPQMTGGAAATPEQAQQQKMMKWMMPFMMLFIFYPMPSGLTLYVMASTFAGVGEQYIIRRHIKQKEALEASTSVTIDMPGKAPRGSRAKKPKGPFFTKH